MYSSFFLLKCFLDFGQYLQLSVVKILQKDCIVCVLCVCVCVWCGVCVCVCVCVCVLYLPNLGHLFVGFAFNEGSGVARIFQSGQPGALLFCGRGSSFRLSIWFSISIICVGAPGGTGKFCVGARSPMPPYLRPLTRGISTDNEKRKNKFLRFLECPTFAPATIAPALKPHVERNPNPNSNPNLNPYPTPN